MSKTYSMMGGSPGPLQSMLRGLFLIAATIGGMFLLAAGAAIAFFVAAGLLIIGFVVFSFLWARAKVLGKPLMPNSKMWVYRQQEFKTANETRKPDNADGPVIDAHETAHGWSVDRD